MSAGPVGCECGTQRTTTGRATMAMAATGTTTGGAMPMGGWAAGQVVRTTVAARVTATRQRDAEADTKRAGTKETDGAACFWLCRPWTRSRSSRPRTHRRSGPAVCRDRSRPNRGLLGADAASWAGLARMADGRMVQAASGATWIPRRAGMSLANVPERLIPRWVARSPFRVSS